MPKRNSSKDNQQERCMCFIRRHNRTQSVPWIVHRQHQSHSGACVYNKWGTELTRKSYSHLTNLYNNRNKQDLTKSVLTFDCDSVENQLKMSATPDQLREWWGYFMDIEEVSSTPPRSLENEVYCYTKDLAFSAG